MRGISLTKPGFGRRDFLKLTGAAASAMLYPRLASHLDRLRRQASRPNIIVILFDAMSSRNLSVYGYPRNTAPNLERFAERSIVYHSHYAGGNFTIPGTSTLLTSTYPWTHRALNFRGQIKQDLVEQNIFRALGDDYHRLAFGQNIWAHFILTQFANDIDTLISTGSYSELYYMLNDYFPNDKNMTARALDDFAITFSREPASLLFGTLQYARYIREVSMLDENGYPRGISKNVEYPLYFRLDNLFAGLASLIPDLPSPTFAYLHLFPPHSPYRPGKDFYLSFAQDGWFPENKPIHPLGAQESASAFNTSRRVYDEYIATLDQEFGKLFDILQENGTLENSYIVITSDHGELFERGDRGHITPLLYDPIVHIPLLISTPGQRNRQDVYSHTHAVDVLPTLLQIAGRPLPSWTEGKLLPGFGGVDDNNRSIFVVEAKSNPAFSPLRKATIVIQKDDYKLVHYTGYGTDDSFELYNLHEDMEELNNLYSQNPAIAKSLREELLDSLSDADQPYKR